MPPSVLIGASVVPGGHTVHCPQRAPRVPQALEETSWSELSSVKGSISFHN